MRLAALAGALLAGCAALQPVPPTATASGAAAPVREAPVSGRASGHASELLGYLARVRPMSDAQLTTEAARQKRGGDEMSRVKAAIALTLAQGDDAEIVALVEPIARRGGAEPDVRAMAGFLLALAADRRKLRDNAAAAAARVRDERRAQEQLKQRADAATERAAQLQQKLDALTEIERSLSDRQVPNR